MLRSIVNKDAVPPVNFAVMVIDVQQGLCEGATAAFDCAAVIERIDRVTEKARRDNVPVIFIQHESDTGYLGYGSDEWQLASGLSVLETDQRMRKTTPDAFFANRPFSAA